MKPGDPREMPETLNDGKLTKGVGELIPIMNVGQIYNFDCYRYNFIEPLGFFGGDRSGFRDDGEPKPA